MIKRPILLKPLINEKSMGLLKSSFYTFLVDKFAGKKAISKVVSEKFNVNVLSVSTVTIKGKIKLQRTRKGYYQKASFKKAIVQLKKGQTIPLFEQATKEEVEVRTAEGEVVDKVKEKKSLLRGTKVRIEKNTEVKSSKEKGKKKTVKKKGGK